MRESGLEIELGATKGWQRLCVTSGLAVVKADGWGLAAAGDRRATSKTAN